MVAVVIAVTSIAFLMYHLLRPESFFSNRSLPVDLWLYLKGVFLHYDFGISRNRSARPVAELLNEGLPADISLLAGGLFLGTVAGLAGGAFCATHPHTWRARALSVLAALCLCAPLYWVGLMLVLGFDSTFGFVAQIPGFSTNNCVPLTGDPLQWGGGLMARWIGLALPLYGLCHRMTRAALVEVFDED